MLLAFKITFNILTMKKKFIFKRHLYALFFENTLLLYIFI